VEARSFESMEGSSRLPVLIAAAFIVEG